MRSGAERGQPRRAERGRGVDYEAAMTYDRAPVRFDPWQALGSTQRLRARGVVCEEFAFSSSSVGKLGADPPPPDPRPSPRAARRREAARRTRGRPPARDVTGGRADGSRRGGNTTTAPSASRWPRRRCWTARPAVGGLGDVGVGGIRGSKAAPSRADQVRREGLTAPRPNQTVR